MAFCIFIIQNSLVTDCETGEQEVESDPPEFFEFCDVTDERLVQSTYTYLNYCEGAPKLIHGVEIRPTEYEYNNCETCPADCPGKKARALEVKE